MRNIRYDVQTLPEDEHEVRLIYCAIAQYDTSWHSSMHSHPHAELFFCLDGVGKLLIGSESIPLSQGDFFLINPGAEHTEQSDAEGQLSYIVIGVSGVRFLAEDGSLPKYRLLRARQSSHEFAPYFQDVLREVSRQREGYLEICLSILNVLFAKARRSTQVEMADSSFVSSSLDCSGIKQLIDEHFARPITLDWLAKQAHISKYHLSHSFSKQYGVSPIQYLNKRRLEEARYLLANTLTSLNEISMLTGFASPSYFSQTFKRHTGLSPSDYRKAHMTNG